MVKMRNLSIAIAGVACVAIGSAVAPNSAQATIITNNFRVDITEGSLAANQPFFGSFTYDDATLTGSGFEALDPTNGSLKLSFNFLGNTYTEKDDAFYQVGSPAYPQLGFQDGVFQALDFLVSETSSLPNPTVIPGSTRAFIISYDPKFGGPYFQTLADVPSEGSLGTVTYGVQAVPTPALLPGLIGLGVGVLRKRKKVCA